LREVIITINRLNGYILCETVVAGTREKIQIHVSRCFAAMWNRCWRCDIWRYRNVFWLI